MRLATGDWIKLAELDWEETAPDMALNMGIDAVAPGVVAYGCFDGAGECSFGYERDRPKLELKQASLLYFRFGSAASMFFWSHSQRRFLKVWISD